MIGMGQGTLLAEEGKLYLLLAHHGPGDLRDGDVLRDTIEVRAIAPLTGHRHAQRIRDVEGCVEVTAGAVKPEEETGRYPSYGTGLLSTRDGHPPDTNRIRRVVGTVARAAGLGHVHPHQLRHTFATQAVNLTGQLLQGQSRRSMTWWRVQAVSVFTSAGWTGPPGTSRYAVGCGRCRCPPRGYEQSILLRPAPAALALLSQDTRLPFALPVMLKP